MIAEGAPHSKFKVGCSLFINAIHLVPNFSADSISPPTNWDHRQWI